MKRTRLSRAAAILAAALAIPALAPAASGGHGGRHETERDSFASTEGEHVAVALALDARPVCDPGVTHVLAVRWRVEDATEPLQLTVTIAPSDGPIQQAASAELEGVEHFELSAPTGGHVVVVVGVDAPEGEASDVEAIDLEPCETPPAASTEGFRTGDPTRQPRGVKARSGRLREVDVAYLGGGAKPIVVTGAGTGVAAKLTSWSTAAGSGDPVRLTDAPQVLEGAGIELHVLAADVSKPTPQMLLSGIVAEGTLWLSTWRVADDGAFQLLDSRGFGSDEPTPSAFDVEDFAIAHRNVVGSAGVATDFRVVTPVAGRNAFFGGPKRLRLATWNVNAATGAIQGLYDSGDWGDPHADDAAVDVIHQPVQNRFVVTYRQDATQVLVSQYWDVLPDGLPSSAGVGASGLGIDGLSPVADEIVDAAAVPLGGEGFVSALRTAPGDPPTVVTWESRIVACDAGCYSAPFRIADDGDDTNPGPGVELAAPPALTDSFEHQWRSIDEGGAQWADERSIPALATGDVDGDGDEELALGTSAADGFRYSVIGYDAGGQPLPFLDAGFDWPNYRAATALAMGDVDGDGDDELAVGRDAGDGMRYLVEDFTGDVADWPDLLEESDLPADRGVTALAMGDVDGDSDDELVVGLSAGIGARFSVLDYAGGGQWTTLLDGGSDWPADRGVSALAVGDVDGDGDDEVAVGRTAGDGMRYAVYDRQAPQQWASLLDGGSDWPADRGVSALALGDVDDDDRDELAIGRTAGDGDRYFVYDHDPVAESWSSIRESGSTWPAERQLAALAAGDVDGDGDDELAFGRNDGDPGHYWVLDHVPADGAWPVLLDEGWDDGRSVQSLATGDVDGDGDDELAFGRDAGPDVRFAVVAYDGLVTYAVRALLTDDVVESQFGQGQGALYSKVPPNEPALAQNASIAKFVTLLLAVEAIEAGQVDLDTVVEVSDHAAATGGSHMGADPCVPDSCLEAGDDMPLDLLLHGMMLVSGNKAAVAVAEEIGGSEDAFVIRMNERANEIFAELGLPPRFDEDCVAGYHPDHGPDPDTYDPAAGLACFTNPAGSSLTTLQDLVTLWRYGSQYPLFRQLASATGFAGCGIDHSLEEANEPAQKCYVLDKTKVGYPGIGGWKGGGGGHHPSFGFDWCTSCVVAEATRLGRTFVAGLQQTGDRWGDVGRLFNWGYATQFAPDARGTGAPLVVRDFGLDAVDDDLAVTASVDQTNRLEVCMWDVDVEGSDVGGSRCATTAVEGLPGGPPENVRPTIVDVALLADVRADGDYVVGHAVPQNPANGKFDLVLSGWRVGRRYP